MRKFFTIIILVLSMHVLGQVPTNGLVGYWPFNGNANDESGYGSNGVVNGATLTTDRFGNTNKAYNFDGSTSYIRLGNFNSVNLGASDFTFSCWIKVGAINTWGSAIFSKSGDTSGRKSVVLFGNGGIGFDTYGKCYNVITNLISMQQWYHVVCVCIPSLKTNNFYINNAEYKLNQDPQAPLIADQNSDVSFIGKTALGNFFNGAIDDIRIYNRILTQQERNALYDENECFSKTTIDTTTYHVSDSKFQTISSPIIYVNDDTLRVPNGGCMNYRIHYAKFVYSPNYYTDTIHVSTADTLVINASIAGLQTTNSICTIKVYPNPAKDHIVIDYGNYVNLSGYTLKIANSLGASVFTTAIIQQISYVDLKSWNGNGIYLVHLIDSKNNTVETRKIIIQ